jgi:hypothetical protein
MNHTPDATATAGNGGNLDPQLAAALLDQTTQQARRRLAPSPPWLLAIRAVAVLAVCGTVWLSVRGQHPYHGPTAVVIPVLIAFIVLNFAATVAVRERALAGVSGTTRFRPAEIAVLVASWAAAAALVGALSAAGVSFGQHPTTVLIIPGLAWAGVQAAREGWRASGTGLAVAAIGIGGALAGPAGSWAVAGAGLCAVLLAKAVTTARRQPRRTARP